MAGKRHHTIPRFFIKGFSSKKSVRQQYSWVYKRGSTYESNINNISVGKFFYGEEDSIADQIITDFESSFAAEFLDKLLSQPEGEIIDDSEILLFIGHLCLRTQHFRSSLDSIFSSLLKRFKQFFEDDDQIKSFLTKQMLKKGVLENKLKENHDGWHRLKKYEKAALIHQSKILLPQIIEQNFQKLQCLYTQGLEEFIGDDLKAIIKIHHNQMLAEQKTDSFLEKASNSFSWTIYKIPDSKLILGDSVCLFESKKTKKFSPFSGVGDLERIFVPISSDYLLIGQISSGDYKFEINSINQLIAASCYEFFVSSQNSEYFTNLQALIGRNSSWISDDEFEKILEEVLPI